MGYDFARFVGQLEGLKDYSRRRYMQALENDEDVKELELFYDIVLEIYEAAEASYGYDDD